MVVGEAACAGCARSGEPDPRCAGALARRGIIKVHWESWSDCNLSCRFCYRSRTPVSSTEQARTLIDAVAYGGARQLVLAGGDPSLRRDLGELLDHARSRGLATEVQTNSQFSVARVRQALLAADLVGLSLDGASAEVHDGFRDKRGNFDRVLALMDVLETAGRPFVVRSVVAAPTAATSHAIGRLLSDRARLRRWAVVQFSPIEDGFRHRAEFEISDEAFRAAAARCRQAYTGTAEVNVYPNAHKGGTYCQIASDGRLFGSLARGAVESHSTIGRITTDHLADLADALDFDESRHRARYLDLI